MARSNSNWEHELERSPFKTKLFTDRHMDQVQQHIRQKRSSRRRLSWVLIPTSVALCIAMIFLFKPAIPDAIVHQVSSWFKPQTDQIPPQPKPEILPDEQDKEPIVNDNTVQFNSQLYAYPEPTVWGMEEPAFIVHPDWNYELLEEDGEFVKIRDGDSTGWVLAWYIVDDSEKVPIRDLAMVFGIVDRPAEFYAYPDTDAPVGFELQTGKVVRVLRQYGEWVSVDFQLYAEPMDGEKWMRRDTLVDYEDRLAREGYMRFADGGSHIYNSLEGNLSKEKVDSKITVMIDQEYEDMYRISSPGGRTGYIYKEDFVPNPFEVRYGTYLQLSSDVEEAFQQFIDTRDEEKLRGLEPIDLFKIYQHARMMGDNNLQYDLLIHDEAYEIPSREDFLNDWEQAAQTSSETILQQLTLFASTEVKTQFVDEDEAYIQPSDTNYGDWFFRLIRNEDGIWKVAWMAMQ